MRETLVAKGQWRSFEKGQRATGDIEAQQGGLIGVSQGAFDLMAPRADGELVVFLRFTRGNWLGDLSILAAQRQLVSMEARVRSELLFVPAPVILGMVDRNPAYYREFYRLSYHNFALAIETLVGQFAPGTDQKIAFRLLQFDRMNAAPETWLDLSQNDLADMLGLSIASVRRSLARLTELGTVEQGYGKIRIDRPKLLSWIQAH